MGLSAVETIYAPSATLLGGQERGILRAPTSSGQVGVQTFSAKKQGQRLRQRQT